MNGKPARAGRWVGPGAVLLAAGVLAGGCAERPPLDLLLVTLDTTRADRLGCYGYPYGTTPELDRLAAEGVLFERAIAQAAVTPVSHASILTGLDPYHHGLRVLHGLVANKLPAAAVTLAEVWRQAGGESAAFVSAFPVTAAFGLDQGFDRFDADFRQADGSGLVDEHGVVNAGLSQRRADDTTTAALGWIEEQADSTRPLLLWVHYFDPHDPLLPPPPQVQRRFLPAGAASRGDRLRALYDAEVAFMDAQIGRLLEGWRRHRDWERTVVAVVADHGEGLGDHGWWSHGILYQEQIRVPMLLRAPGLAAGQRVRAVTPTIDLMPTVLELTGIAARRWPKMDGGSLAPSLLAGQEPPGRLAYADSVNILTYGRQDDPARSDRKDDKLYGLIDGPHKLIYHQLRPAESEFYDLAADPGEERNLAPQRPPDMERLLRDLRAREPFSEILPGMTPTDLERLEQLEALGYVE